jgi:hypothetical protein
LILHQQSPEPIEFGVNNVRPLDRKRLKWVGRSEFARARELAVLGGTLNHPQSGDREMNRSNTMHTVPDQKIAEGPIRPQHCAFLISEADFAFANPIKGLRL